MSEEKKPKKKKKVTLDSFGGPVKGKPGRPRKRPPAEAPKDIGFVTELTGSRTSQSESAPDESAPAVESFTGYGDIYSALNAAAAIQRDNSAGIPDVAQLMNLAISADLDPTIFTEQSFPVAENVIEWCRSPKFLGFNGELWPRQIETLARFFGDVCYLCSDTHYVHNVPVDDSIGNVLDRFVLLQHGICPKCRRNRTEMLKDWSQDLRFGNYNDYDEGVQLSYAPPNEFVGVWGQRSGKSYSVATFAAPYVLHRYLALPSPPRYFERPSNIILEAVFVAPTLHQVNENMWLPFREIYESSPWFREVKKHLISEGKRVGIQLYHAATTFILFPGKRIAVYMLAASAQTLRGATRIYCVTGDALVNTTDGLIPIKQNITGKQAYVSNRSYKIVGHTCTGKRPVQRTVLECGYNITTTLDHKIMMLTPQLDTVWKQASELRVGDHVALNLGAEFPNYLPLNYSPERSVGRTVESVKLMAELGTFTAHAIVEKTNLKGIYSLTHKLIKRGFLEKTYIKGAGVHAGCTYKITKNFDLSALLREYADHAFKNRDICTFPSKMTTALGYLLGYYVAEGSYNKDAAEFSFSNTNEVVVEHFANCFEQVFGFAPRIVSFEQKNSKWKTGHNVVVAYKVVKEFLRYVGLAPATAATKTVPWSILQAPKDVVLAFLSAFIEGDGSISDKYVYMSSTSKQLIAQLQLLLLSIGVVSTIRMTKRTHPGSSIFNLRLNRYDSIKLAPLLSCPTKGKFFDSTIRTRRSDVYKVPFVPPFIDTSLHGGSVSKYVYLTSALNEDSYDNYALRRLEKSDPETFSKVCNLIDKGVIWLPVKETKQLGSREVYDVAVDSAAHAFTANGIVVHNCTLDELGWFSATQDGKKRSGVKDGTEVFNSLSNSLTTIRSAAARRRDRLKDYNALDAYMFNISSPSSISDPIMQRASIASQHPRMYYSHHATWEVNPWEDEQTIKEQTAGKPDVFQRDFCAIPPRAMSPFFPDAHQVRALEVPKEEKKLFEYTILEDRVPEGLALLRPQLQNVQSDPFGARILAVDNGEVNNSFALCLARFDMDIDGIVYEEFVEVAPYRGFKVDLAWCYNELIIPLIKSFSVLHVVFDRWNSAVQVMDLRTNQGVAAERYTLKYGDFDEFRNDVSNTRLRFPPAEASPDELIRMRTHMRSQHPNAHFQLQLTTVEQFGRKLFKPENGTDDLFRVAVLAHAWVKKNRDIYVKHSTGRGRRLGGSRAAGVFRGASQRSQGLGGSGSGTRTVGSAGSRGAGAYYNHRRKSYVG